MSVEELLSQVDRHLPPYLTPTRKSQILEEIRAFPRNGPFYWTPSDSTHIFQGDCWDGLAVIDFKTGNRQKVRGLVLSNTCDIDPSNPSPRARNIVFAPVVRLAAYLELLDTAGKSQAQVAQVERAIRNQEVFDIFFITAYSTRLEDSIAILDDLHSHPLDDLLKNGGKRTVSLNDFGFWLFILKLSIHFCRIQEGVARSNEPANQAGA